MNLEVEVTAGADSVTGFTYRADPLALPDPLSVVEACLVRHVGVEVAAVLAFSVDQHVPAVEDRVEAAAQHVAVADRDQLGTAGGGDVEAFVDATAAARRVELADRPPRAVRSLDREDVAVIGDAAVAAGNLG